MHCASAGLTGEQQPLTVSPAAPRSHTSTGVVLHCGKDVLLHRHRGVSNVAFGRVTVPHEWEEKEEDTHWIVFHYLCLDCARMFAVLCLL